MPFPLSADAQTKSDTSFDVSLFSSMCENQKSGLACWNGCLSVFARRGLDLACKPLRWLLPNTSQGGGPHNTLSLLRQDQFAEPRGTQLIGLSVMRDADVAVTLQQRIAAEGPCAGIAASGGFRRRRDRCRLLTVAACGAGRAAQGQRGRARGVGHSVDR